MPGLSHGGPFKETSVFAGLCRLPRSPLPMGETQGTLARARLESLLRPRHKKRAEAQKRSESFLLSGLGKRPSPAGARRLGRAAPRPRAALGTGLRGGLGPRG